LEAYDDQQLHENGLGLVRRFLNEWDDVQEEINNASSIELIYGSATLVTGKLFGPVLQPIAEEFGRLTGTKVDVKPITNQRLGESITAAGLLMGEDILEQLLNAGYSEIVILPRVTFDHPELISLDDLSPQEMADKLGRPVALADTIGDVWDALTGQSNVIFEPKGTHHGPKQNES